MTQINKKSILMGIIHSVIIPLILVYVSKNLFIGWSYYLIPLIAYETFASDKTGGKSVFYGISIFVTSVIFIAIGGM